MAANKTRKADPSVAKKDENVAKVSSYRVGGQGKLPESPAGIHPQCDKKSVQSEVQEDQHGEQGVQKVKLFLGAKSMLVCVGFVPTNDETMMELTDDADMALKMAEEKVDVACVCVSGLRLRLGYCNA